MSFWVAIAGGYLILLFSACLWEIGAALFKFFDLHGNFDDEAVAGVAVTFLGFFLLWVFASVLFVLLIKVGAS